WRHRGRNRKLPRALGHPSAGRIHRSVRPQVVGRRQVAVKSIHGMNSLRRTDDTDRVSRPQPRFRWPGDGVYFELSPRVARAPQPCGKNPLAALALAVAVCVPAGLSAATVSVFAAASLTDCLKEIAAAYEKQSGDKVVFNFGASSFLARQIEEGAPADI